MKKPKNHKTVVLFSMIIICLAVSPGFSQVPEIKLDKLKSTMDDFANSLALSLPFNSGLGLNWSDAHIQNFPHFGVGASVGLTTMKSGSFGDLLEEFDLDLPKELLAMGGLPIAGVALESRLGGFFLPFDVGFKISYLPIEASTGKLNNFVVGGDFRYLILKERAIVPAISAGMGFNYMSGEYIRPIGTDREINFLVGTADHTLTLKKPTLNIDWSTASLDFKAQASKTIAFITPYFGIGASNGWSKAGYNVETKIDDPDGILQDAKRIFKGFGIEDLSSGGFSSEQAFTGWSFRTFGGFAFKIAVIRLDITALYNFIDYNYGLSLGIRLQL